MIWRNLWGRLVIMSRNPTVVMSMENLISADYQDQDYSEVCIFYGKNERGSILFYDINVSPLQFGIVVDISQLKYKYGKSKYSSNPLTIHFPLCLTPGSSKIKLEFLIKQRLKLNS